jgi:nicotinate-nucleotide adenylyltransferase
VGILGGTFNPPHVGHLAVAQHALRELALDVVELMPAHASPHKRPGSDPGPEHRLRMCRLAAADAPQVQVSTLEVERGGLSYTVDTLTELHAGDPDAKLTLILGADTAITLGSWREVAQLLRLATLAVATRSGAQRREVTDAVADLLRDGPAVDRDSTPTQFLQMPAIDVSSSAVRARVARGEPIDGLVAPAVASYIAEHGLYRTEVEAGV